MRSRRRPARSPAQKGRKAKERRDREYVQQFAENIRALYPNCPRGREDDIARHACEKHSRRVGRTAAAKELKEHAIHAAVRAHVRHNETNYDHLLKRMSRPEARRSVAGRVRDVLKSWATTSGRCQTAGSGSRSK